MKRDYSTFSPKILISPDKFKGSMTAHEISSILKLEIEKVIPSAIVSCSPLADGGDGSIDILAKHLNLEKIFVKTIDPLGRYLETEYYRNSTTAYIELASSSGLVLLKDKERNPFKTSTYGTGLEIKHAIENGVDHVYLFLGGSSTNDGGIGIASALGFTFLDNDGNELPPIGSSLDLIRTIISSRSELALKSLILCCDVNNPPTGENGAASVYAQQKGASKEDIEILDQGMINLCNQVKLFNSKEVINLVGGGAAGGVPVCLVGLLAATIVGGVDLIIEQVNLEDEIKNSDFVISGEGRLDEQSLNGKVVSGVARLCKKYKKPLYLTVGINEIDEKSVKDLGVKQIYEIISHAKDIDDAMENGSSYLSKISREIAQQIYNRNL
jgi:glycerate kinase